MGTLYIVSTPIGNLKDITLRALEVLASVDYILCEDTRVTGKLLSHLEISKRMVSFGDFNEESKKEQIIAELLNGTNIALVSDAGTPLISDPGFKLVRDGARAGVQIESIPGPSAAVCALTVSGLPTDKFLFVGYLPKKDGKRLEVLRKLTVFHQRHAELVSASNDKIPKRVRDDSLKCTVICYESPFRLLRTLADIKEVFGDIDVVVCRELTKMHEEVFRGIVGEALEHFKNPRGEFVVLF